LIDKPIEYRNVSQSAATYSGRGGFLYQERNDTASYSTSRVTLDRISDSTRVKGQQEFI